MKATNKKGFTLTEILIVIVIAGILLALILPNTLKALERANVSKLQSDINSIDVALAMCFAENKDWTLCNSLPGLFTQNYLENDLSLAGSHPFGGAYAVIPNPNNILGNVAACSSAGTNVPPDVAKLNIPGC